MTDDLEDDFGLDTDEQTDDRTVTLTRQQIRSLERDAKQARKANEEAAATKRELAFVRAGIDPDDPKLKYFAKGYDGEINADAIRAAATEAGFLTPTATSSDEQAEATASERIANASAGAAAQPPTTKRTQIEELQEAGRTGGRDAVLAKIREHGHNVI